MKRILLILAAIVIPAVSFGQTGKAYGLKDIPNVQLQDHTRFTSNPDGILSAGAVYRIDTTLLSLKRSGKAQVAVIAVNSIGSADPHDFLVRLMHKDTGWGVGSATSDNGLGILLVIDQGAIEIATGYGLEGDLPDAIAKRVIDNYMLPSFRQRDWDKGMIDGVTVISEILNGRPPENVKGGGGSGAGTILSFILLFFAIPFILVLLVVLSSSRCPRCKKRKLRRTDTHIVDKGKNGRDEVTTYVCQNCGYVKKVTRHISNGPGPGAIGGGMIMGGMMGRGRGGGGFGGGGRSGGSWGGGGFGGGGARGRF